MSKKFPYNKIVQINHRIKRQRKWKHPFIDKIKAFFTAILKKFKWDKSKEKTKEEPETFIQGLLRINSEVKLKSNHQSNVKELVPHKMYKAKDLLAEIRSQKEMLLKAELKRIK